MYKTKLAKQVIVSVLLLFMPYLNFGQKIPDKPKSLMDVLPLFTQPGIPELGTGEEVVAPLKLSNAVVPPADLPGKGLAQHPMIYFGECYNIIYIVNQGKIIWTYQTGGGCEYDDVWMLSNGNILFTRMQYIAEVTPMKEVVWRYDAPQGTEIHGCQPIGLDKILFLQNGKPPTLFVYNLKSKKMEVTHELPVDTTLGVHAQFRRVRYTAEGTYLVPFLQMNKVVEYDQNFKEIWRHEIKSPWSAVRLKNGNTLITDERDLSIQEVNNDHEIVWELKPTDLPEKFRYINTQCCTRLDNGNTIVCSRGDNGKGPQLVEVTPDKKVVWVLWDWKNFGPASGVQILDEPYLPENPGQTGY